MIVKMSREPWNGRRYGKPWVAEVTSWPVGGRPAFRFGGFIGNDDDGGFTEIEVEPGAVLRTGQKDNRGGKQSGCWYVVEPDGATREITEADACDYARQR